MPRRSSRSVTGCMTCRRRKVKCNSRATPCEPCRRLGLSCVSSFQQNFRAWSISERQESDDMLETQAILNPRIREENWNTGCGTSQNQVENSPQPSAIRHIARTTDISPAVDCTSPGLNSDLTRIESDGVEEIPLNDDNQSAFARRNGVNSIDSWMEWDSLYPLSTTNRPPSFGYNDFQLLQNAPSDHTWDVASWNQYMSRVPEWLSTKRSMWSCYHYLINLAQAIPDSPLFHGILSWTYAYLFRLGLYSEPSRLTHYMTASDSIRLLSNEVSDNSTALTWLTINPSDKISQYISTTFFLCQHDLIVGDFASFRSRLIETKRTFSRHWKAQSIPGPIESRIVIWLAFMELRFLIMGGEKDTGGNQEQDLMTILMDLKAVPTLRGARKKQSYLSECFGNGLPKEENDEDLRKERCREKFDALSFYLSRVRAFEKWDLETQSRREGEPLLVELREAKIDALRADLARIQAECEQAFPNQRINSLSHANVDSSMFHIMTVKALCLCATIMLHRAIDSAIRTDPEAQSAARNLIRLCRIFRKAKRLDTPCSVIWPLPIFIAGIEIADEIYQDWIVDYMRELGHWGAHVVKGRELMEQTLQWQERHGCRASVRDFAGND